ncbi:hypothetical protein Acr_12g0000590 [Actinidia rufa]|uniref:Uncharacterized protein n=1 Tax=Actinidia rufa TaxID=165716 RepID=A0A7J0FFR3_9ERIC|nr:hypothetical protein Acr_12g0000590 [Actinidia rufa]
MAPKSSKSKKKSLAMVVSTPPIASGQKRKAQDDADKGKEKKKKGESSSTTAQECNILYFDEDASQESMKMDNLGWKSMTTMREEVYSNLVKHFYANASKKYQDESINTYVKGESISLDRSVIREILGIGYGGEVYIINLDDEIKWVPKAISVEYNEKTLKRMGYELQDNKWTPKPENKKGEASGSKEKSPSRSGSVGKTLISKIKGLETSILGVMAQMQESMQKLHVKVGNVSARLLLLEKKMQEMDKKMDLQKKGKENLEESESEEEKENEQDEQREEEAKHKGGRRK